jgi:hypothetical protein
MMKLMAAMWWSLHAVLMLGFVDVGARVQALLGQRRTHYESLPTHDKSGVCRPTHTSCVFSAVLYVWLNSVLPDQK